MQKTLLIIFGKPGAGKSFVAEILQNNFGYTIHDGDEDIPDDMKKALFEKKEITDDMRKRFLANMISSTIKLSHTHNTLVLHQTLLKTYMRDAVLEAFPYARFLLVVTDDAVRERRYLARKNFNLGLPYLRKMSNMFDSVTIPYIIIRNDENGTDQLVSLLSSVISQ